MESAGGFQKYSDVQNRMDIFSLINLIFEYPLPLVLEKTAGQIKYQLMKILG
jgi:hypothetical protein